MMNELGMGIVVSMKDMFTQNAARVETAMNSLDASVAAASERMSQNLDRIQKGTMMIGAGLAMMAVPAALIASTAATQKALAEMASARHKGSADAGKTPPSLFPTPGPARPRLSSSPPLMTSSPRWRTSATKPWARSRPWRPSPAKPPKRPRRRWSRPSPRLTGSLSPMMKDVSDVEWAKVFLGRAGADRGRPFKTTGPQMAEAIKNVGATASASLIPLEEQMAILGQPPDDHARLGSRYALQGVHHEGRRGRR